MHGTANMPRWLTETPVEKNATAHNALTAPELNPLTFFLAPSQSNQSITITALGE
jgi:hypothetical protein